MTTRPIACVSIVGAGAFGLALAVHLSRSGRDMVTLRLYDADAELISLLAGGAPHPRLKAKVHVPDGAELHHDLADALEGAELLVLAVPGRAVRSAAADVGAVAAPELPLLSVAKALDRESGQRLGEVVAEERGADAPYAVMAGGMIAAELVSGKPLGASIGCTDSDLGGRIAATLGGPRLYLEATTDVVGVEYAGALKNMLSIGAGLLEGLEYPLGSRTLFLARASAEVREIATALGARPETFSSTSQCWGNDMILSTLGQTRNRAFGAALAGLVSENDPGAALSVRDVKEVLGELEGGTGTVEGYHTAGVLPGVVSRAAVSAPRLLAISAFLRGDSSPSRTVEALVG